MIHAIVGAVSLAAFTAFVLGALVADAWILTDAALVRVAAMHALGRFCHLDPPKLSPQRSLDPMGCTGASPLWLHGMK